MPKLTPEERKALKKAKKVEQKRLALLKKRQLRHDYLSREVKYAQLTTRRHERDWRRMLIDISISRLREDMWFTWYNFERVIDAKDFTISLLMDEIKDAEEQYMRNLSSHAENIDNLVSRFRDGLDELKESSENELASMYACAEEEADEIRKNAAESEEYYKTMLFGLEMARREQEQLVRGDLLSKLDEEGRKYWEILQNLRIGLEKSYSNVWDKTKAFLSKYAAKKAERCKAYAILAAQDKALQNLCEDQRIKLRAMQEFTKKLKLQYINLQETQGAKVSDLRDELQYFADAFNTLKSRSDKDGALDKSNLAIMTATSNETMEYLEAIAKKGQRLLKLAEVCRKLETQEEKILPFPIISESTSKESLKFKLYKSTENLQLFWQRTAQADAVRHSISEEKEALRRENKMLKQKVHQYCQCLQCWAPNELKRKPTTKLSSNINVVDGYIVQKNYMKH